MPSRIEVVNGSTRTRSSERIALAFFFRKPAVFLDHQVFGRIGADGVAGGLARPFAGSFFALARLEAGRLQALLGARKTAADAQLSWC